MSYNVNLLGQSDLNCNPSAAVPLVNDRPRDPNSFDSHNYTVGWHWLNKSTGSLWYLASLKNNVALWIELASGAGDILFLTGNDNLQVTPLAGNINLKGDGVTTNITRSPDTHSLLVALTGITQHSVQIGGASNTLAQVGVGATNTVLLGNTGADPSFGTVPNAALQNSSITIIGAGSVSVAGSPVSLGGTVTITGNDSGTVTSISAGTGITLTPNPIVSTGTVALTVPVVVSSGGTGATTLTGVLIGNGTSAVTGNAVTQHSVLVGGASNAITSIANGTTGQILTAQTGADPIWASNTASSDFKIINIQVFTSSGTYTPTANMQYCIIEVVGGGGGGGGAPTGANPSVAASAGGGSGGYSRKAFSAATIGVSQSVAIGAAGAGGTAGTGDGGAGGTTSVGAGPLLQATGGNGGVHGGTSNEASNSTAGTAGVGSIGALNTSGQSGQNGMGLVARDGATSIASGGSGGSSYFGGGALGATISTSAGSQQAGINASNYGSGGSGAISVNGGSSQAGGNGSAGVVVITEYISS